MDKRLTHGPVSRLYFGLVLITVLTVFLPVLNDTVIDLDDTTMIYDLFVSREHLSIQTLFFPEHPVTYYRPVLMLTNYADSFIWDLTASGFHLTNYILHVFNVVLVYALSLRMFVHHEKKHVISCFSALFFGLHPLTCESVAWVCGRSDLLSLFFCLLAMLFYSSGKRYKWILTPLFFYFALLSKENALAMLPVLSLYEWFVGSNRAGIKKKIKRQAILIVILSLPLLLYIYARTGGFDISGTGSEIIAASGKRLYQTPEKQSQVLFKLPAIIAFYFKKIVIPYPLNFAIHTINYALYSCLFVVGGIALFYCVLKKQFGTGLFIVVVAVSFFPALLLAWADVAWTPYAERYLYLTLSVFSIGIARLYSSHDWGYKANKLILYIGVSIIIVFSLTTFQRNTLWADKQLLWADTYEKNPEFARVLYKYGHVLGPEKGVKYHRKAVETGNNKDWLDLSLLALAHYEKERQNYSKAVKYAKKAVLIAPNRLNYVDARRIATNVIRLSSGDEDDNIQFVIHCSEELYKLRKNPNDLYQIASWQAERKNYQAAKDNYKKLIAAHPDSRLIKHAHKELNKLNEFSYE